MSKFDFDACQMEHSIDRNFALAGRRMFMTVFPSLFITENSEFDVERKFSLKNNCLTGFYYDKSLTDDEKEKYINACYANHSIYAGLGLDIRYLYYYVCDEYRKIMEHNIALMKLSGDIEMVKKMQFDYSENIKHFNSWESKEYNAPYFYGRVVIPSWVNSIENLNFYDDAPVFEPDPNYDF